MRGRCKANHKKHGKRWKTTPAKLDSAAVFHLPQQIAGMIAEHVPARYNEVQMHQVSSATHHYRLWPWENYLGCWSSLIFSEHCRDNVTMLAAQGLEGKKIFSKCQTAAAFSSGNIESTEWLAYATLPAWKAMLLSWPWPILSENIGDSVNVETLFHIVSRVAWKSLPLVAKGWNWKAKAKCSKH